VQKPERQPLSDSGTSFVTTDANHIAQRSRETGARHAFGIPGGEVPTVMDALAPAGIAFQLVEHEAARGFMADAVERR
jgi:acetolactate synthase-1/2/3 large subunit